MFARSVSLQLKPNCVAEFARTIEKEIIPLLRKQQGFQDEITFVAASGVEAVGISLWDGYENAEAYNLKTYPEVLKALQDLVEGEPKIQTFEVSNSTFHKVAVPVAV